ncbi:MAG TPA: PPC domain-containing protein [Fimbriiglobus sp.]|jgi:hypothetical protein
MYRYVCAAGLIVAAAAVAQPPQNLYPLPRIETVFPAGVRVGTSVDVTLTGTDLEDATGLTFSHPGISAEIIVPVEPKPDPKAAPKGKPKQGNRRKRPAGPVTVKAKVTVAADVPVGTYDVRVVNQWGVSNPRAFVVGTLPEVNEKEPNNDVPQAQRVALGTVVNGVISSSTDVDYFVFAGKAGQRVLLHCATSSIDSKAMPLVEVFNAAQRRVGMNRNYQDGDALADVTLPADGDYFVRVSEFAYQYGGADWYYRLTLGSGPWIDAVFPPRIEPGKATTVTVVGRNLPGGKPAGTMDGKLVESVEVTVTPPKKIEPYRGRIEPVAGTLDCFEYRFAGSNPVPIYLASEPVVRESAADNDVPEKAQALPVPCEVAGRIDRPNDRDWYSFQAKKGEVFIIDLFAERVGSHMDAALSVHNAATKQVLAAEAQLDDDNETLHPIAFYTRTSDPPSYRFTAPQAGTFLVRVSSREASVEYGPRSAYQLRIGKPRPDFRVVVVPRCRELPAATAIHPGEDAALDVLVQRVDGFTGPVTISAAGLPPGVTATPTFVGTNQRWATLVLTAAKGAKDATTTFAVTATATIDGKPVATTARSAAITWAIGQGQNVPAIARLDQTLPLAVRPGRAEFRIATDLAKATVKSKDGTVAPVKPGLLVRPGDKITVPVKVHWLWWTARPNPATLFVEPTVPQTNQQSSPFTGQTINLQVPVPKEKGEAAVTIDLRPNCPPGQYAATFRGDTSIPFQRNPDVPQKNPITISTFSAPFEFTVIPSALARLTVRAPKPQLKPGESTEITVRADRLLDYAGEFQIAVTFPKEGDMLIAAPARIAAGQTETKVKITAYSTAKPVKVPNVLVTVTGVYDGKYPVAQNGKVNLTIQK